MPSLPSHMLRHVIVAECLAAVLALLVQRCLPAALGAWLNQRLPGPPISRGLSRFKVEPYQVPVQGHHSTGGLGRGVFLA